MSVATTKHGFGHRCRQAIRMPRVEVERLSREGFRPARASACDHMDRGHGREFSSNLRTSEPFFLKVSFIRPHSPYDPPERWMKKYENARYPRTGAGRLGAAIVPSRSGRDNDIWHGEVSRGRSRGNRARLTTDRLATWMSRSAVFSKCWTVARCSMTL